MSSQLKKIIQDCRQHSRPIGLVTGVFDLLHRGHLDFLRKAQERMKEEGGCLVVGVESDVRVKRIKGEGRPVQPQDVRVKNLVDSSAAKLVFVLPEKFDSTQDHLALITQIKPKLLLVSEHTPHLDKKTEIMDMIGGKVEVVSELDARFSTTQILQSRV